MKPLDHTDLESAFLPPDCLMFSDLIARLSEDNTLKPERVRDMTSGLKRVAKALARPVSDLPADTRWLQPRLNNVAPAALGISRKSWQNILSDARAAMAHFGIVGTRQRHFRDLTPEWQEMWRNLLDAKDPTLAALRRFVHFLSGQGVDPNTVTDAHARDYLDAVTLNEISKDPETAYRAAVNNWNLARKRILGWPDITLTLESRQKVIILPDETYLESFHVDLDALMERMAHPDPLDPRGYQRALRPQTLFHYRRQIIRFAAELVHAGIAPEDIQNVSVLIDPAMAEKGLRHMLAGNGNETNRFIADMAGLLRNLARVLNADDDVREHLAGLAKRLKVPAQKGMTRKNRDRLRVLQDPQKLRQLLLLPELLFKGGRAAQRPYSRALACEDALAIGILLYCPVRAKNLSGIHLEKHIQRPGDGRAFLVFNDEDTKTKQPIEFEIPQDVVRMIDQHLAARSPEMCPKGTPWLFPRRDGTGHITTDEISSRIRRRILRETGIEMNAHLFRHLAVMLWLNANPSSYEAARRLLGHSDVSHTLNLYSGMETQSAMSAFSEMVASTKATLT